MRAALLALSVLVLGASALAGASAPSAPFGLIPFGQVQWDEETPNRPDTAGLAGRWQVILVVNREKGEGRTGRDTFSAFAYDYYQNEPLDQRFIPIAIGVDGPLANRHANQPNVVLKGSGQPGLLRALAGDADAALVVVAPDGRVRRLQRHAGGIGDIRHKLEKELGLATPLAGTGTHPAARAPALELLRVADVDGALGFIRKKLGSDGIQLAKELQAQADALIAADAARFSAPTTTPVDRFIAGERLKGLLMEFPALPAAPAALAALRAGPKPELQAEARAWAALQDYLAQMGKAPAKRATPLQQQLIPALIAAFPGTYAAEIAGMIKTAARIP